MLCLSTTQVKLRSVQPHQSWPPPHVRRSAQASRRLAAPGHVERGEAADRGELLRGDVSGPAKLAKVHGEAPGTGVRMPNAGEHRTLTPLVSVERPVAITSISGLTSG